MSLEHENTIAASLGPLLKNSSGTDRPRSDTAFPSAVLMGLCFILVVALVGVTGWKVLLLNQEQEEIRQTRAILERDISANQRLREELPQLEEQHRLLSDSVAQLEGEQKGLQQTVADLTHKRQTLVEESSRLSGENVELSGRIDAIRKELGQVQGELANAKPLLATLQSQVAAATQQEADLHSHIAEQKNQEATLTATIHGLERDRTHAENLLAHMTEDRIALEGFKKSVDSMAMQLQTQLQTSLEKADTAITAYTRLTTDVQASTHNLDSEIDSMQTRLQRMGNAISILERNASSFSQVLEQGGSSNQELQTQIQELTTGNKQLETILLALDTQIQQWTQRSQAPLSKINNMEEKLLPIVTSLSNAVQAITTQATAFEAQVKEAQTGISIVQRAGGALDQHVQSLSAAAMELQSGARSSQDSGKELSELINTMQQDIKTLTAIITTLQTQKQEPSSDNQ